VILVNEQIANSLLDQLASNEVNQIEIQKDDFEIFRNVLVNRPDFKYFRGVAQRGGHIVYYYMDEPRS
jgi:hypothetical protein